MARLNKNSKLGWDMIKILKGKNLNLFSFFSNVLVHLHFSVSLLEETAVLFPRLEHRGALNPYCGSIILLNSVLEFKV